MPAISNIQLTARSTFNAPISVTPSHGESPRAQLAAINTQYPKLEESLEQARADVASCEGSDTWAGLRWYEKAVFFVPPFGPLIGVMMLDSNKDMIRSAEKKLGVLENIAVQKNGLESKIAANLPDRLVA